EEKDDAGVETAPISRAWSPSYPLEALDSPVLSQVEPSRLSTFEISPDNILVLTSEDRDTLGLPNVGTLVSLSSGQSLSLLGTYCFTVLRGSVNICGLELRASKVHHRVFAPSCAPLPVLVASSDECEDSTLPSSLSSHLSTFVREKSTLVFLSDLVTGVEGLGNVCTIFDGVFQPPRRSPHACQFIPGLTSARLITKRTKDLHPFVLPKSWANALSAEMKDNEDFAFLVRGTKKSGKSTFARTLVNSLLTRFQNVAYLETDVGQPEFTPAGMLSLHVVSAPLFGPPFTHPALPFRAHFIGETTPKSSPSQYLSAVQDLYETYRLEIRLSAQEKDDAEDTRIPDVVPLIVNCMGWTKGLGADLTFKIERIVGPATVFNFDHLDQANDWPPACATMPLRRVTHYLERAPSPSVVSHTPADFRALSILSYFFAIFPDTPLSPCSLLMALRWSCSVPLCAQLPYQVDVSLALDGVVLSGPGSEDVVDDELIRVLDGALVGLVSCEYGELEAPATDAVSGQLPYVQGRQPPAASSSFCLGLALVRSVSPSVPHMLHILTPLPPRYLPQCRVLVKGPIELPVWGMLDFREEDGTVAGVERDKVSYLRYGRSDGVGAERRRVRRNLMRRSQM
ncbi:hypothetical protein FISHEDRAFT_21068, partial [Fistulina hepatica ATCC 64428]